MSLQSTACRPKAAPANPAPRLPGSRPHPDHYQAHGRLYRAIVSVPADMCERDRPLQERWVFFDCPGDTLPGDRLEALLALAWNIDTTSWCDRGLIYNVSEASELIAKGDADDDTALFECEWGSHGTKHVPLHDVDFFCTPRVRARLELALLQAHVRPALKGAAAIALPPGDLPLRDRFMNTHGGMHLESACGNVEIGLHPQHSERYQRAPVGAWWASEIRRDSNGQPWIKHSPSTYYVVNDFGHLVEVTRP